MRWYAETPIRRSRQVLGDLLALTWVVLWVLLGRWVHGLVSTLAAPADPLRDAGVSWRERMTDIAGTAADVPLVGGGLGEAFTSAGTVGDDLVLAGDGLAAGVDRLAWLLAVLTAGVPIVVVGGAYLLLRLLWARRTGRLSRDRTSPAALELFALRALVHQPPARLAALGPDPVGAWRSRDPAAIGALADLELRQVGLRGVARRGSQSSTSTMRASQ